MQNLIAFLRRFRVFLFFAILQVICLLSYVQYLSFPKSQFFTSASSIGGEFYSMKYAVAQHFELENSNLKLQKENIYLRKRLIKNLYQVDRNLFKIKDTSFEQQYNYIPASVINSTTGKMNNYFTINIGDMQGVKRGMGVFSSDGVVGIIHNTSKHYSVVKSVLTQDINIDVLIQPIGLYGFLKWDGKDPTRGTISGISNDLRIKKWSKVYTRGGSGIFPKGILVGRVEKLAPVEGKPLWDVVIKFSQDFRSIDRVYVIKNLLIEEQKTLELDVPEDEDKPLI